MALINNPQAWAAIFVTQKDRRSFVEMCLERSFPASLEVTVHVHSHGRNRPSCSCNTDNRTRVVPNEISPCNWHFVFESLVETRHSTRIRSLIIRFSLDRYRNPKKQVKLALGCSQFFDMPSFQLTSLNWNDSNTGYATHLFSVPPLSPTLRTLSFSGSWHDQLLGIANLSSLTLERCSGVSTESFQKFIQNNQSLKRLSLAWVSFEGASDNPPIDRIPAFEGLCLLSILALREGDAGCFAVRASRDGMVFTVKDWLRNIPKSWERITGSARSSIKHIRLENPTNIKMRYHEGNGAIALLTDVCVLEVGRGYVPNFYPNFWDDLKGLGPQLKTIRFEIPEETEPFRGWADEYKKWGGEPLDAIEDLVIYRSSHGRPFSCVERMVVSDSKQVNREQKFVWRYFFNDRRLGRYIQTGEVV